MIQQTSILIGITLLITITEYFGCYIFDNKMLSYLLYLFLFGVGYHMVNRKNEFRGEVLETYVSNDDKKVNFEDFEASGSFDGRRPGYVFKKDVKGLGYYLDK